MDYSIPLITGVVLALVWANLDSLGYASFLHQWPHPRVSFHFLVNELFMVFFFGLVTKEVTQNCLPGGALHPPAKAINPILGTLGGVVVPVGVYFLYIGLTGREELVRGFGIPTATDIALAWLVAKAAFGEGHPAVTFLLLLAIADDGIGLAIIAIFYPHPSSPVQPIYLLLVLFGMTIASLLAKRGVGTLWPYLTIGGTVSWLGFHGAGLHPALAWVPIVPFLPGHHRSAPLHTFERFLKRPVLLGLVCFGLANAGVTFSSIGSATWAVLLSLWIGKTVGIFTFSSVAALLGFSLPSGMNFKVLFVVGMTASIGMTVALFVADVAFTDPALQGAAKMGALMSSGIAPVVLVAARWLRIR